jgi:hypothetical protein
MSPGVSGDLGLENFRMRQTWIEEKTEQIKKLYHLEDNGEAFLNLAYSLIFDVGINDINAEDIVDADQDKQIDIIHIDENENTNSAHIYILQVKNESGFKSKVVSQLKNGLSWIFSVPKNEYEKLDNFSFVNKITEVRDVRLKYDIQSIRVTVYYVTNGNALDLSPEYLQEKRTLESIYKNSGFKEFEFKELGAFELFDHLKTSEQAKRKIDAKLQIVYDVNKPSIINYSTGETKAMICTTKAKDLAELACIEPKDAIFDMNVRSFYGIEGNLVNSDIYSTCTKATDSSLFWFLNNGVTMVCDHFIFASDPDYHFVDLKNVQIVNGCQTTVTLREAYSKGELKENVNILLRIYETSNSSLTNRITLTTNNQNKIVGRDLKANDMIQADFQKVMFDRFGYYYERKNKEYTTLPSDKKIKIIPNDKAGQAFLAIVGKKPSIARGFLGKIWGEYYDQIFKQASVEDLLLTYLIYTYCNNKSKKINKDKNTSKDDKEIATYGAFHIARVIGFLLVHDRWGNREKNALVPIIKSIEKDPEFLTKFYTPAFDVVRKIRIKNTEKQQTTSYYFKAGGVQEAIEAELYHSKAT